MTARQPGKREQPQNRSPAWAPCWAIRRTISALHCGQAVFGAALGGSGQNDTHPPWTLNEQIQDALISTRH